MDSYEVEQLTVDALRELGIAVAASGGASDVGWDIRVEPGGTLVEIKTRTLIDIAAARRLVDEHDRRRSASRHDGVPAVTLMAVASRVTSEARRFLSERGAGYFDLRGHIALRTPSVVIDVDVEPRLSQPERRDPFSGKVGLEVATALLMEPLSGFGLRQLARRVGRAPSTLSEIASGLIRGNFVDERLRVVDDQLFWQVAERWSEPRTHLSLMPPHDAGDLLEGPLRLGLGDVENSIGWAMSDSMAALAYGAPLAVRATQPGDFFVPDASSLSRAERLLGVAGDPSRAACTVRVAPVPAVCRQRVAPVHGAAEWPLAHPVFVALDLAQDVGRGREILEAWTPAGRWHRVW